MAGWWCNPVTRHAFIVCVVRLCVHVCTDQSEKLLLWGRPRPTHVQMHSPKIPRDPHTHSIVFKPDAAILVSALGCVSYLPAGC